MVYVNGVWTANMSYPWYNATGLTANTSYTISTRTVDTTGNVNLTWVNHTTRTAAEPTPTPTSAPEDHIPVAAFSYTPQNPVVGQKVTFDASASVDPDGGSLSSYLWNFGDKRNLQTTGAVTTHVYRSAATYTVTLTITDDEGAQSSTSKSIQVGGKLPRVKATAQSSVSAGDTFAVTITAENVMDMAGDQATLHFDPTALTVMSVTEGDFLKGAGTTLGAGFERIDNTNGTVTFFYALTCPESGVNESGVLATIIFSSNASQAGSYELNLARVKMADGTGGAITLETANDTIELLNGYLSITAPEARTYASTAVELMFTIHETNTGLDWLAYALDGGALVSVTGTTVIQGLTAGEHTLILYARDTAGNELESATVHFTIHPGDINGDTRVDVLDYQLLAWAFMAKSGDATWNEAADLNCDRVINIFDQQILAWHFGTTYS